MKFCTHLLLSWVHVAIVVVYHGVLHVIHTSLCCCFSRNHFYFTRCATLEGKSLYNFFNFFNSNNGTATTLNWSINIWFGKWWQLTIINPALPGTNCSMQMLTDWSRTRFLNVVFTSIIITSHVESYETVYLFVIRICRIFVRSTIV